LDTEKSFGGGALKEGAGLGVDWSAEKIVRRRITNLEMNRRIEGSQFHEVRLAKVSGLCGWFRRESFCAKFRDRADGSDEDLSMSIGIGRDFINYDITQE
jgi:hypothetical protein